MNSPDFDVFVDKMLFNAEELMKAKGQDYAGSEDRLANFKRNAERLGLEPIQIWAVYFFKHIDALESFLITGNVASEPIQSRFLDAINYLILGAALIAEGEDSETDS